DSVGEPFGRQLAADLGALQRDLRHHRARQGPALELLGQGENAPVELAVLELALVAELERAADLAVADAQPLAERADRELGLAGARVAAGIVPDQVAVERERNARGDARCVLE